MNESKEEIMEATYRALCEHGYADLTIEKIAEESDLGKSAIYYHFKDKHDLVISFLRFMIEKIEEEMQSLDGEDSDQRLKEMLDMALAVDDEEMWEFRKAIMEMRAQTPHDKEFSEKFSRIDDILIEKFRIILENKGLEKPEEAAELLVSAIDGMMNRKITQGSMKDLEKLRDRLLETVSKLS